MKKILLFLFFILFFCGCTPPTKEPNLISINIIKLPDKVEYYQNEEFDFTGLEVELEYDNSVKEITEDYKIDYDNITIGTNTIYIKYQELFTSFEVLVIKKEIINISIITLPNKLFYYDNEELNLDGLVVQVEYNNNEKEIIDDYKIEYNELIVGTNLIYIKYGNIFTTFEIEVTKKEKIKIVDYLDYSSKTLKSINFLDYDKKYDDIEYGKTRGTNMLIVFDETYFVNTNIYGYEVAVDKYGVVVEKGTNVSLKTGGLVVSGHGTSIAKVKEIELGDIILFFDKSIYVYKNKEIGKCNTVFSMFNEYLKYIETLDDIDLYNEYVYKLNNLIPLLDNLYEHYDDELAEKLINELKIIDNNIDNIIEHEFNYSYECLNIKELNKIVSSDFNYQLTGTYNEKLYIGGFRNADTLVYYDKTCYRERNSFGFEVGIDKNGIVVTKDTLVKLEEDGFILSGHGSGATFLIENVEINDKIEIKDGKAYIYRDFKNMLHNSYVDLRNKLVQEILNDYNNEIPHDYQYLNILITEIDSLIKEINVNDNSLDSMINLYQRNNTLNEYIAVGYAQLFEYKANLTRGIWYYPFTKLNIYDDTTKEGVIKTIETYKKMGINEIIIYVFAEEKCLFDCTMYKKYDKLNDYDYGEYGNDYLKCFIEECHKRDIIVNAFTQTFHGYVSSMKNPNESYYQINFQGEQSIGNIFYYDICNDNLQNEIINWYTELVSKYDFDKVEYDIIRYPSSNVYNYVDKEVISESSIQDHGYTEYTMNKFLKQYNLSGDLRTLVLTNKTVRKQWMEFKEQELINFITNCTNKMKEVDPNIIISAAVMSNYSSAKNTFLQDYRKWLELSIIDEIEPMAYTPSTNNLNSTIDSFNDLYNEYNVRIGISPRIDDRNIITDLEQMYYASKKDGYVMFASTLYYDNLFKNILINNHNQDYLNDLTSDEKAKEYEINDAIDMINGYYSVINNEIYDDLVNQLHLGYDYLDLINNLNDEKMKEYLLEKLS